MPARAATYLDFNAGAPLSKHVIEALFSLLSEGGSGVLIANPSSTHGAGRTAKKWLTDARIQVAQTLGPKTQSEQIVFTSSGTEANQLAIRSILEPRLIMGERPHWITSAVEHDSVTRMASWLQDRGGTVSLLPVNKDGVPQVTCIRELWRPETVLTSVIWANNETGVLTDVQTLSETVRELGGVLHLDAAQALGKIPIDATSTGAQLLSFSGHKIGALSGTGFLWFDRDLRPHPAILGAQERGLRGGTENVAGIVSLGAAAAALRPESWMSCIRPLRDRLERVICERIPGVTVNGGGADRVANTLNLSFEGVRGDSLVMALDFCDYYLSTGAACSSGVSQPSRVLMAMGRTPKQAMASVRVSLSDELTWETLDGFLSTLEEAVRKLRGGSIL
jgi:cysteine desulfurase